MEKQIRVIARYHYSEGYFVEVSREDSVIASRDYWLCRKNSARKMYMFSSPYKNSRTEEHMLLTKISDAIQQYEHPVSFEKYA
ncbi:MAG: hypothetical protein LUF32_07335 [Clostridiales bacterium]|nr:hypothetical protein [Clostridiales bacterium]